MNSENKESKNFDTKNLFIISSKSIINDSTMDYIKNIKDDDIKQS